MDYDLPQIWHATIVNPNDNFLFVETCTLSASSTANFTCAISLDKKSITLLNHN